VVSLLAQSGKTTCPARRRSKCTLTICIKPLARQGMPLWHLDRVLDTQGGVHGLGNLHKARSALKFLYTRTLKQIWFD
jgi:hypothetical protein